MDLIKVLVDPLKSLLELAPYAVRMSVLVLIFILFVFMLWLNVRYHWLSIKRLKGELSSGSQESLSAAQERGNWPPLERPQRFLWGFVGAYSLFLPLAIILNLAFNKEFVRSSVEDWFGVTAFSEPS